MRREGQQNCFARADKVRMEEPPFSCLSEPPPAVAELGHMDEDNERDGRARLSPERMPVEEIAQIGPGIVRQRDRHTAVANRNE
jgi:hypothetical protein